MAAIDKSERLGLNSELDDILVYIRNIERFKERGNIVLELIRLNRRVERMIDRLSQRY